jgi:hypothetical protein
MTSPKRKSAKQKHTNEQLERCVFIVDEALGNHSIVSKLCAAGWNAKPHREFFSVSATDEDWLYQLGKRIRSDRRSNFVSLTKDKAIQKNETERTALLENKVRQFVLASGSMTNDEMAAAFIANQTFIAAVLAYMGKTPFIARLGKTSPLSFYTIEGKREYSYSNGEFTLSID